MRIFVIAIALAGVASAATGESLPYDSYLHRRQAQDGFSGVVLIAKNGKPLYEGAFGEADIEHGVALSNTALMRIGSLTKPFTAIAVMRSVDAGKMKLSDPICRYLASCPAGWAAVTIDQLLMHRSGLPDLFTDLPAVAVERTVAEIDKRLGLPGTVPREAPGTSYRYNNFGYILLGYALEKVYGRPYPQIMSELVFRPAAMPLAIYDYPDGIIPGRARSYVRKGDALTNTTSDPAAYSAGGLLLSDSDFLAFDDALFEGRLMPPASRAKLFEPPAGGDYGRGWQVKQLFGRTAYRHNGGTQGAAGSFLYFPDEHLWIDVLSNVEDTPTPAYVCDLAAQTFQADYLDPTLSSSRRSDPQLAGTYDFPDGEVRKVTLKGDSLYYQGSSAPLELAPLAPGRYALMADAQYRFDFQDTAQGTTMTRSRCGGEIAVAHRASP